MVTFRKWYLSLKLVLEVGTLVLFPSIVNKGDLFENQQNEIFISTACNSDKIFGSERTLPIFCNNKKFMV